MNTSALRLHRWVLLTSLVVGLLGTASVVYAVDQYLHAAESFDRVSVEYVPDSFVWRDTGYEHATARLSLVNGSDVDITVELFEVNLNLDGRFAGAMYQAWKPVVIPRRSALPVDVPLQVTSSPLLGRGGEAEIRLQGRARFVFAGIGQDLIIPFQKRLGQVNRVEG